MAFNNRFSRYSKRKFIGALKHFLVGRFTQAFINIIVLLVLVRVLTTVEFGGYMAVIGLIEMMIPLSSLGMLEAVRRYIPEITISVDRRSLAYVISLTILTKFSIHFLVSLIIVWKWKTISTWLGFNGLSDPILIAATIFGVLSFRFCGEILEALMEQRYAQTLRASMPILQIIILALAYEKGELSIYHALLSLFVSSTSVLLITLVTIVMIVMQHIQEKQSKLPTKKEIMHFMSNVTVANIIQAIGGIGALRLIIANRLGLEIAGFYSFLQQLAIITNRYLPTNVLSNLIRPIIVSRYNSDHENEFMKSGMNLLWKTNYIIVIVVIMFTAVIGDVLISLLSGGRIAKGEWLFIILLVGVLGMSQRQLMEMYLQVVGKSTVQRNMSVFSLLTPVVMWLVAPQGLWVAILASITTPVLWNIAFVLWEKKINKTLLLDYSRIGGITMVAIIWLSFSAMIEENYILKLILSTICLFFYGYILYIMKPYCKNEVIIVEKINKYIAGKLRIIAK